MKIKRLKLDWNELEEAFTNQNEELVYFLDLVAGQVKLEGEDDVDTFDDDDHFDTRAPTPVVSRRNDPTRAYVEPPDTATKLVWLEAFLGSGEIDAEVKTLLEAAMADDNPAPAIRNVLNQNTDVRDDWYLCRADRIRELIDTWLKGHAVEPVEPAPWHSDA